MLATGTGLAPFLSILHDFQTWESYDNLVLVQSVRTQAELAYEELIQSFDKSEYYAEFAHKLRYLRIVTREPVPGTLRDRVTKLLTSGVLEENVGLKLDHERSRIMLCGNPEMVEDSRKLLVDRGFRVSRRGDPGHLAVENYW
jgi:ferredoxin--NADP+ reductase